MTPPPGILTCPVKWMCLKTQAVWWERGLSDSQWNANCSIFRLHCACRLSQLYPQEVFVSAVKSTKPHWPFPADSMTAGTITEGMFYPFELHFAQFTVLCVLIRFGALQASTSSTVVLSKQGRCMNCCFACKTPCRTPCWSLWGQFPGGE